METKKKSTDKDSKPEHSANDICKEKKLLNQSLILATFDLRGHTKTMCLIRGAKVRLGSAEMAKNSTNFCPKDKHSTMCSMEFHRIIYRVLECSLNHRLTIAS
jgi:hypothetical protein